MLLGPADDAVERLLGQRAEVRNCVIVLLLGELHLAVQLVAAERVVLVQERLDDKKLVV